MPRPRVLLPLIAFTTYAAVLAEATPLRLFVRWWMVKVAALVLVGLTGRLVGVVPGRPNLLIESRTALALGIAAAVCAREEAPA